MLICVDILFRQDGLQRLRNIERLRRRAVYGDLGRNLDLVARQNVDRLAYLDRPDAFAVGVTRNLELNPLRVGIVVSVALSDERAGRLDPSAPSACTGNISHYQAEYCERFL